MTEGEERTVLYERGEMLNQIEALQQENEQLKAQNGAMVEALHECNAVRMMPSEVERVASEAIAAIDKIGGREEC